MREEKLRVKVNIRGIRHKKYMRVSGIKVTDMDMEYGKTETRTLTWVSGITAEQWATECLLGLLGTNMKVNGCCVLKKAKGRTHLQMVTLMRDRTKQVNLMGLVFICGLMAVITKESL